MNTLPEEYTSDEGNYSSLSSTSLLSTTTDYINDNGSPGLFNLHHHNAFEKLVKKNAILHEELHSLSKQLEMALSERPTNQSDIEKKMFALQQDNVRLIYKNKIFMNDQEKLEEEVQKLQVENAILKEKLNDQYNLTNCKLTCITQLKEHIASQQEEILKHVHSNSKQTKKINNLQSELDFTNKSLNWYKSQWKCNLNESADLFKELLKIKNVLVDKVNEINSLKLSSDKTISKSKETQSVRETNSDSKKCETRLQDLIIQYLQDEIKSLSSQILHIKQTVSSQNEYIGTLNEEKCALIEEKYCLQNRLEDIMKQLLIFKQSHEKYSMLQKAIQVKNHTILNLKSNLIKCKAYLDHHNTNNEALNKTVASVFNDFQKFKVLYEETLTKLKETTEKCDENGIKSDKAVETLDLCENKTEEIRKEHLKLMSEKVDEVNALKIEINNAKVELMVKNLHMETMQTRYERYIRTFLRLLKCQEKNLKKVSWKKDELCTKLESTLKDVNKLKSINEGKDNEIVSLQTSLRKKNARYLLLEEILSETNEKCFNLNKSLSEKNTTLENLQIKFIELEEAQQANKTLENVSTSEKNLSNNDSNMKYPQLPQENIQETNKIMSERLAAVTSENSFLQRLLCDVKIALRDSANKNKNLLRQLQPAPVNNSRALLGKFPDPAPIDEAQIFKLIEASRSHNEPLVNLKVSVNVLKEQVASLQEQIYSTH